MKQNQTIAIVGFLPGAKRKQKPRVKHVFSGKEFLLPMTLTEAIERYPYQPKKGESCL